MLNNNEQKNEVNELSKYVKLKECTEEYAALGYDDKKEYMKILTQWYMRQKDLLTYNQNHIK